MLLCLGNHRPVVDDGPAGNGVGPIVNCHGGIHEIAVGVVVTNAEFGKLAGSATHGVLMALGTGSAVEYRAQPAVHIVNPLVGLLIESERVSRSFRDSIAGTL